jgi:Golgi apparatus protein 1
MLERGRNGQATGISLTGWTAILGMAALLLLAAAGVLLAYRRYVGSPQAAGYTLVLKKGGKQ